MGLADYRRKRHFAETPEPAGTQRPPGPLAVRAPEHRRFCVQQHAATRLHYDLRLEMGGVLKSWAVPKGPTLDPEVRRLALQTEDHPLDYLRFEGEIPTGNYGAGSVVVWDIGDYELVEPAPPLRQWERGSLKFILRGERLRGQFALVKLHAASGKGNEWLLIKKHDTFARFGDDAARHRGSVLSGPKIRSGRAAPKPASPERKLPAGRRGSRRVQPRRGVRRSDAGAAALALPGAEPGGMPGLLRPMLATAERKPFSSPDWLYEIKWDGVRALAYCRAGSVRLVSRTGQDMSRQYPELSALGTAWREFGGGRAAAVVDGEIVALDARGAAHFSLLQQRIHLTATRDIQQAQSAVPVVYYAFDLLYLEGARLLRTPLELRKTCLRRNLQPGAAVRLSDHVLGDGLGLLALAREQRLEGIVAKRRDSVYTPGRSRDWLKFKLEQRQAAAIAGYTDPRGTRDYFGALLLAVYEPDRRRYRYIGNVGTGFSRPARKGILQRLQVLPRRRAAIEGMPRQGYHPAPLGLVAEVKYLEWTPGGKLRAPVYLGLRADKTPRDCVRQ
ncbi:MAG: non-homologous end-joining DNA ligase [Terriglobales bacterium]